ncbi:Signal recognition particle receptor FtsY [uncultured archaeon]|nr:Signal recognition particle receptor FtsY [uncultured archaeon]
MFAKLKEKLKDWTKNITKKAEETSKKESKKEKEKEKAKIPSVSKKAEKKEQKKEEKEAKKEKKAEAKILKELNIETEKYEENLKKLEEETKKEEELEEEEEERKPGSKSFFQRITSGINKVKVSEKEYDDYSEELENILLENNVALEVAERMVLDLKEKLVGREFLKKEVESGIKSLFGDIIGDILINPPDLLMEIKGKNINSNPYVILFCGINGSGKTTTIAKVANYLKSKNISCLMAAADTFRAASIEQIKEHGNKLGIKVISHDYGSDPASVGFDAIQYAKKNSIDCVLIDTAGRMHTQKNLLREMEKIVKVCKPDKKLFIGESITGNDAVEQVRSFNEAIGIDGIILTKADIDEKGGTALSVGYVTKKPIFYLGTGQEYNDIEPFNKNKFIEKLGL